jgi:lysophospholipase L1-like esterase
MRLGAAAAVGSATTRVPEATVPDHPVHRPAPLRRRATALVAGLALALATALGASVATSGPAASADVPLPSSMASTGDSITRAYDVSWAYFLSDAPAYSWSTGTRSAVNSHYSRIRARNPAIAGRAWNEARSGARMADLAGQLTAAAGHDPDYVTVLMGANDACTSTISGMTPTATFTEQFRTALAGFSAARPDAEVFVASIPNLYQLWSVLRRDLAAQSTWAAFEICPSMLSLRNTESQRQQVLTRVREFNAALAAVCAQFPRCRYDGGATFSFRFGAAHVSKVDYFHPSVSGEAALASTTWAASFWPTS